MKNQDKILGLIEKMNTKMEKMHGEFNNRFNEMENKFNDRFNRVESEIKKNGETITRIENKMDDKFGALFDGHGVHNDKLDEISNNVNNINQTLSQHDLMIKSFNNVQEDNQNNDY